VTARCKDGSWHFDSPNTQQASGQSPLGNPVVSTP